MNNGCAKFVDEEKDLGVLTSKNLKFLKMFCAKNKANMMLVIINIGV